MCSLPGGLRPCISGDTIACMMGAEPEEETVVPVDEVIVVEAILAVEVVVSPSILQLIGTFSFTFSQSTANFKPRLAVSGSPFAVVTKVGFSIRFGIWWEKVNYRKNPTWQLPQGQYQTDKQSFSDFFHQPP